LDNVVIQLLKEAERLQNANEERILKNFTQEEIDFFNDTKRLLSENREIGSQIKKQFSNMMTLRGDLEDLEDLEDKAKMDLKNTTISQMTIRSEMQSKVNFMKQALHESHMNLGKIRKSYVEKRKIVKALSDTLENLKSDVNIEEILLFENNGKIIDSKHRRMSCQKY